MTEHGAYNRWCQAEGILIKANDCIACLRADLRAALASRPQPHRPLLSAALDEAEAEIDRLRHALTNVADNLHGAGLISETAKADILQTVAGSETPTGFLMVEDDAGDGVGSDGAGQAGSATPEEENDDG